MYDILITNDYKHIYNKFSYKYFIYNYLNKMLMK